MRRWVRIGACAAVAASAVTFGMPPGDAAVEIEWMRQDGTAVDDEFNDAVAASLIIVGGSTAGSFAGGSSNQGGLDGLLRSYTSSGAVKDTDQFGGAGDDVVRSIAFDIETGFAAVGTTTAGIPGASPAFAGGTDGFVRMFDGGLSPVWTRQFGGTGAETATAVSLAGQHVYVGMALEDGGDLSSTVGGIRRYTDAGDLVWQRDLPGTGHTVTGVAADHDGVYVVGAVQGALPGRSGSGGVDSFVRRYDNDGNVEWTRQFGTAGTDRAADVAVGPALLGQTGAWIVGSTDGDMAGTGGHGADDVFLVRVRPDGTRAWIRQIGTKANDRGVGVAYSHDRIFLTGTTNGVLPGQTSSGGLDQFVTSYRHNGERTWTRQFGSAAADHASAVAAEYWYDVYAVGSTDGEVLGGAAHGESDGYATRLVHVQPDAKINAGSGRYRGENIYNRTGARQTQSVNARPGESRVFNVRHDEDGNDSRNFRVAGCASGKGFAVRYWRDDPFHEDDEITAEVVDGTYRPTTAGPPPGIRIVVRASDSVDAGAVKSCALRFDAIRSDAVDTVRAVVKIVD